MKKSNVFKSGLAAVLMLSQSVNWEVITRTEYLNTLEWVITTHLTSPNTIKALSAKTWISQAQYLSLIPKIRKELEWSNDAFLSFKGWTQDLISYCLFRAELETRLAFHNFRFDLNLYSWVIQALKDRWHSEQDIMAVFMKAERLASSVSTKDLVFRMNGVYFYSRPRSIKIQQDNMKLLESNLISNISSAIQYYYTNITTLAQVRARYWVAPEIVVATLHKETRLWNKSFMDSKVNKSAFAIVSTQLTDLFAFIGASPEEERRIEELRKKAKNYLIDLIDYALKHKVDPFSFKSNSVWAIWISQFMPTNLQYARDWDRDWKIDLHSSHADAIMSTWAFYYFENNWTGINLEEVEESQLKKVWKYNTKSDSLAVIREARMLRNFITDNLEEDE